eukprot:9277542-Karenia_brevis.AAC.1
MVKFLGTTTHSDLGSIGRTSLTPQPVASGAGHLDVVNYLPPEANKKKTSANFAAISAGEKGGQWQRVAPSSMSLEPFTRRDQLHTAISA